ncbi:hypothetical protein QFC20_005988 [Naganishia adeliensis]|uniref:Uncharacterized protein n=1 Tax=Naganishia adeliensis TaxID=92952 RepID=A0ACC2VG64_9TREE|nr:hypothetical protein QFC20_005988 [Naganishia adeliensis]
MDPGQYNHLTGTPSAIPWADSTRITSNSMEVCTEALSGPFMVRTGHTDAASIEAKHSTERSFKWTANLPGFESTTHQLSAAKGLGKGNVPSKLVPQLSSSCQSELARLSDDDRQKAYDSLYRCYGYHVNGGKEKQRDRYQNSPSRGLRGTEARSGGSLDGRLAENLETIAGTAWTVDSEGNGGLDIPADYETMSNHKEFWKTRKRPTLSKTRPMTHSTFRLVFKAKVDVAFTERFPKHLRSNPDVVQWEGGEADEENFRRWSNDNPGYVHIWVDEKDMHAKFQPAQA